MKWFFFGTLNSGHRRSSPKRLGLTTVALWIRRDVWKPHNYLRSRFTDEQQLWDMDSAANMEIAYDGNMEALRRYFFRPRVLRDMSNGSTRTSFLGITSELPIYIAPAAMAKLGHPLGEVNLTRAAGDCGIVQAVGCLVTF